MMPAVPEDACASTPAACHSCAHTRRRRRRRSLPAGFRGVSAEQDSRFVNKEKKLMKVRGCSVCWRQLLPA